jgi:RNA polymerase sigma factor (sigma-70 family)
MDSHALTDVRPRRSLRRLVPQSDDALRALAARGDPSAFGAIYARHHPRLYRYCRSILGHHEDAGDAVQNTMLKAWEALGRTEPDAPLRPWLFRIAHNEAISLLRVRRATRGLDTARDAAAPTLEDALDARQRFARLRADLAVLPERQRSALLLRELCGLSHSEIAEVLEVSPATARQTIYEARLALHQAEAGRNMACDAVRRAISDGDGRILRGRRIRSHVRDCAACASFEEGLRRRPGELAALAPPLPGVASAGLIARLLSGAGGSGRRASVLDGAMNAQAAGFTSAMSDVASTVAATVGVLVAAGAGSALIADNPSRSSSAVVAPARGTGGRTTPAGPALPAPVLRTSSGMPVATTPATAGHGQPGGAALPGPASPQTLAALPASAGAASSAAGTGDGAADVPGPAPAAEEVTAGETLREEMDSPPGPGNVPAVSRPARAATPTAGADAPLASRPPAWGAQPRPGGLPPTAPVGVRPVGPAPIGAGAPPASPVDRRPTPAAPDVGPAPDESVNGRQSPPSAAAPVVAGRPSAPPEPATAARGESHPSPASPPGSPQGAAPDRPADPRGSAPAATKAPATPATSSRPPRSAGRPAPASERPFPTPGASSRAPRPDARPAPASERRLPTPGASSRALRPDARPAPASERPVTTPGPAARPPRPDGQPTPASGHRGEPSSGPPSHARVTPAPSDGPAAQPPERPATHRSAPSAGSGGRPPADDVHPPAPNRPDGPVGSMRAHSSPPPAANLASPPEPPASRPSSGASETPSSRAPRAGASARTPDGRPSDTLVSTSGPPLWPAAGVQATGPETPPAADGPRRPAPSNDSRPPAGAVATRGEPSLR